MLPRTDGDRHMGNYVGPFRIPTISFHQDRANDVRNGNQPEYNDSWCQAITHWELSDSLARWSDGTTNQLLFAEKHIPAQALSPSSDAHTSWNGGYQLTYEGNYASNATRVVSGDANMFARSPADTNTSNAGSQPQDREGRETIGSSHAGTVNILVGDASVRGMSKSTEPLLVWRLTHVFDGISVSLP